MSSKLPVNILMVDDQPAKLLSYETILADLKENLIRANSGREALEHLLRTDFAVVLVDVCMPELDGFELAAMIRSHPRFQKTAVILVSGVLVDDVDRLKGYDSGAVDYVSVPIVPEILRAKVAVFAELFRKTDELARLNRELEERVAGRTAEIQALLRNAQDAQRDAETANRLKDEFLATLSHELRTPLHAIVGWAQVLQSGGLDAATQLKAVETINRNAQLQAQLISDILDVSRIITGKLRLNLEPVKVSSLIQAAVDTVRPAAQSKGIHLTTRLGTVSETISADPGRLQQVFWNLLANAVKFAPTDGHVEVQLQSVGEQVEVTVQDDGPGIRPEFLPYIFNRFRQADSSSTRPHHGLGLGLAIVRHLLEMHGGTVAAANREETGAVFTVALPRVAASAGTVSETQPLRPAAPELAAGSDADAFLKGVRVLVVDDEPDAREMVAFALERCGAEVRVAASAAEALAFLEREPVDVLVSDIEMPGQDGYSLIRDIRGRPSERGGRVPAVALTGYAGTQDRSHALGAGFQMHLTKPVQPFELATAIAGLAAGSPVKGQ